MIKIGQEGEQAGAGLMSGVTVLIDRGTGEVASVRGTDPSWFPHIAVFNYAKCFDASQPGKPVRGRRLGNGKGPYIMRGTLCAENKTYKSVVLTVWNAIKSIHPLFLFPPLPEFISGMVTTAADWTWRADPWCVAAAAAAALSPRCAQAPPPLCTKREMLHG